MIDSGPSLRVRPRGAPGRARLAVLATLVLGWLAVVLANWPGHLSYDSVAQLLDGRTGRYHTWHPPAMAWLLGLCDALLRGTGLYVALQALVLFAALAALAAGERRVSWWALLATVLLCASPLVFVWQAIVWKDVLFADLAVGGFVALRLALEPRRAALAGALLAGLGFLLLGLGSLVRQNGMIAVLAGVAALGHGLYARAGVGRLRAVLAAAAALALVAGGVLAADAALFRRAADPNGPKWQLDMLQTYDIVGVVAREPRLELGALSQPTAAMIRVAARDLYTPARNDDLLNNAFEASARRAAPEIGREWRDLVLRHPLLWLRHRAAVFFWLTATPDLEVCYADATGIDGRPDQLAALGLEAGQTPRDAALEAYAGLFHPTPVYSHLAYAILAAVLMVVMFRSRRREDAAIGFMLAAALLFALSFAVIGVACDYRYLYALDLSAMTAAFYAALRLGLPTA